jgi:hypothetical protein
MKHRWIVAALLAACVPLRGVAAAESVAPFESGAGVLPRGPVDEVVFARLRELDLPPARNCSDAVFVRRVFLDVIGTLPTGREAWDFIRDTAPDKRQALIDALLERPEFADYWAMKWCDLLRVKSEFPINLWPNAVQAYHRWIRESVKSNLPYDRFVRELLTANGSNFRVPPVNFYRAVQNREAPEIARAVALSFMGERADDWSPDRLAGLAAFFAKIGSKPTGEWKEEILYFDPEKVCTNPAVAARPVFPDGTPARIAPGQDPRIAFADWLTAPTNPWLSRAIANRAWSWFMGRGIVHEPDDIRDDNPPVNPALLACLQRELVSSSYDLRRLFRLILNSQTYQLSSIPATAKPGAEANFAFYPLRRLEAEVFIDALCAVTGTAEEYESPIPEPFTFVPKGARAIELPDGSITSTFLEMFGRPPRDTGISTERNNQPSASQRLHMLNSSHIRRKIEQSPKLRSVLAGSRDNPRETIDRLYLSILSRPPTDAERISIRGYLQSNSIKGREAMVDLAWALINSSEFLHRH